MKHWLFLTAAIVLEVAGTTSMKLSEGFTRPLFSVLIFVFYALSFSLLTLALKRLDLGVAYAIWAGVGTLLVAVIGVVAFGEKMGAIKMVSLLLIVAGVAGLHLADGAQASGGGS